MARRLFTLLSGASLALCVATCVMWVAGQWMTLRVESDDLPGVTGRRGRDGVGVGSMYVPNPSLSPSIL